MKNAVCCAKYHRNQCRSDELHGGINFVTIHWHVRTLLAYEPLATPQTQSPADKVFTLDPTAMTTLLHSMPNLWNKRSCPRPIATSLKFILVACTSILTAATSRGLYCALSSTNKCCLTDLLDPAPAPNNGLKECASGTGAGVSGSVYLSFS